MINLEEARGLLRRAVETQGRDFVYNPNSEGLCHYNKLDTVPGVNADDPRVITGCLVGVALDLAGEVRHHGYDGAVTEIQEDFPDMMTEDAAKYLVEAQNTQDVGGSWGQAHDFAEEKLRDLGLVE